MINKFYYSEKQKMLADSSNDLKYFGPDIDTEPRDCYVKLDDGTEKMYSEWKSSGNNSNWDDAVLVFECDGEIEDVIKRISTRPASYPYLNK